MGAKVGFLPVAKIKWELVLPEGTLGRMVLDKVPGTSGTPNANENPWGPAGWPGVASSVRPPPRVLPVTEVQAPSTLSPCAYFWQSAYKASGPWQTRGHVAQRARRPGCRVRRCVVCLALGGQQLPLLKAPTPLSRSQSRNSLLEGRQRGCLAGVSRPGYPGRPAGAPGRDPTWAAAVTSRARPRGGGAHMPLL